MDRLEIQNNEQIPLLSIIIPVYNSEKWLPDCIHSLINQTMQEIEYIFIDDKSTDHSLKILKDACKQYGNKIKIITLESNKRQGGARNVGILAARAEYIGFCDSDDFVALDMYEKLYKRIKETNSDIVIGQEVCIPETVSYKDACKNPDLYFVQQWVPNLLKWDNKDLNEQGKCDIIAYEKGTIKTMLVRKNIIIDNNIWFPEHLRFEDNYWSSLIMPYINKISFVNSILYFYRRHPLSTVNEREGEQYFERIRIEKGLLKEVKKRGLFERYYSAWEYIYAFRYGSGTISFLMKRFENPPYTIMNMIRKDLDKEFPKWKKNRYWKERQNFIGRLISYFKIYCPRLYVTVRGILYRNYQKT